MREKVDEFSRTRGLAPQKVTSESTRAWRRSEVCVSRGPQRISAVFMTGSGAGTPPTLMHNLEHNKVLHTQIVLLTVMTADVPLVPLGDRVRVEPLGERFFRVTLSYGFMEAA